MDHVIFFDIRQSRGFRSLPQSVENPQKHRKAVKLY